MKFLDITDDYGAGTVLICEMHFKNHYHKIAAAALQGLAIIIIDSKRRGCRFCKAKNVGFSPWSGTMFKVWREYNRWE